jgi:hypothetical protein
MMMWSLSLEHTGDTVHLSEEQVMPGTYMPSFYKCWLELASGDLVNYIFFLLDGAGDLKALFWMVGVTCMSLVAAV